METHLLYEAFCILGSGLTHPKPTYITKPPKKLEDLTIEELKEAARFRGGDCLEESFDGNIYKKIKWVCHEGHKFEASVFTILRGGQWCPECCNQSVWNYDQISKYAPFFGQVWYDSHDKDENNIYIMDEKGYCFIKKYED